MRRLMAAVQICGCLVGGGLAIVRFLDCNADGGAAWLALSLAQILAARRTLEE